MAIELIEQKQIAGLVAEVQKLQDLISAIGIAANATDFGDRPSDAPDNANLVALIDHLVNKVDSLGTVEHEAANITARDALGDLVAGDRVFVTDASDDAGVDAGWAIYRFDGTNFLKIAENESLDVVAAATNLTYDPATRVLGNSNGTGFTLPEVVAGGDSGLMTGYYGTDGTGVKGFFDLPAAPTYLEEEIVPSAAAAANAAVDMAATAQNIGQIIAFSFNGQSADQGVNSVTGAVINVTAAYALALTDTFFVRYIQA